MQTRRTLKKHNAELLQNTRSRWVFTKKKFGELGHWYGFVFKLHGIKYNVIKQHFFYSICLQTDMAWSWEKSLSYAIQFTVI